MKKLVSITVLLLPALLVCTPGSAQQFDSEHRHSIELTTGVPPAQSLLLATSNLSSSVYGGFKDTRLFIPTINVGYTYAMNERWDFNVIINACGAFFRRDKYLQNEVEIRDEAGNLLDIEKRTDYSAGVQSSSIKYSGTMYTPMVDFRWKWLRRDDWRLYSSFGLGCLVIGNFSLVLPTPYLTPIGINYGKKHFYGLAEMNISCASTGLMVGVGYRF